MAKKKAKKANTKPAAEKVIKTDDLPPITFGAAIRILANTPKKPNK